MSLTKLEMLILAMLNNNTTSQKSHYKLQLDGKFTLMKFKIKHLITSYKRRSLESIISDTSSEFSRLTKFKSIFFSYEYTTT